MAGLHPEQLRERWRAHEAATPIHDAMDFGPDGLVLGAGTLLAAQRPEASATADEDHDARLLTLLSIAYARPVPDEALKHIGRATQRRREGDAGLAAMHLALTGLSKLQAPREAARRLFMADAFLQAGIPPGEVLAAMGIDAAALGPTLAKYSPGQPRVPRGSGRPSGQWVRDAVAMAGTAARFASREVAAAEQGAAAVGRTAAAVAAGGRQVLSVLAKINPAQLVELGELAATFAVPAVVGGMLFIPTNKNLDEEGAIPGRPGWRYHWNSDEAVLRFGQDGSAGPRQEIDAHLGKDGKFHGPQGQIVGVVLPNGKLAVQLKAVSAELAKDNEPDLCPVQSRDPTSELGRDYEDYVKRHINPGRPTPRGWRYEMTDVVTGNPVKFDDCQHSTGILVEAKGPRHDFLLEKNFVSKGESTRDRLLKQSLNQVNASHGHPLLWVYAETGAADRAEGLFMTNKDGRERIGVLVLPWRKGMR